MRALMAMAMALLALAGPLAGARGALQVLGVEGELRLFRFETEPWPLEPGLDLPDNSRVELERDAKLRLRFEHYLEFSLAGPARLTVYVVPAPAVGEMEQDRVVLKLDEGALLVDGRFQFGRPADIVLSLPDRSVLLPKDERFVAVVAKGSSSFYRVQAQPSPQAFKVAALGDSQSGSARLGASAPKPEKNLPFPPSLFDALAQPVKVFVLARDFNMDLGLWPRPPVLGPLLAERLAGIPGLTVVDGSGSTYFSYRANGALKEGLDAHLKAVAREQGARWLVAGNVVAESLRPDGGERRVQGQAELRLMETDGRDGGLELVSESGTTRVARAGRALELAAREAMEAASAEAAGHLEWHLGNLLQGRAHAQVLLKLVLEGASNESLADLRQRLGGMDTVQRVFRRSFANKEASFDLLLRRSLADFDAQWQAWPVGAYGYESLEAGEALRRYRAVPRGQP
jgi:hypothetical protein